jgi:membrane protease YdiL (CAAX protease family)
MQKAHRDVLQGVALVGAFLGWNALSALIYRELQLDGSSLLSPLRLSLILLGTAVTCVGIVWLGCVRFGLGSFRALGWSFRGRPGWMLLLGALQTVVFSLVAYAASASLYGWAGIEGLTSAVLDMPAGERVFYLIMGSKVAFAEESLFRGFVLPTLQVSWGTLAAVLISGLLFAVYHRVMAPPFLLIKLIFGVVSAGSVLLFRSLVPTAIAHAALWTIFGDN